MKFFNHLAVLALVTFGVLLSACGKNPDEATRELFTQKMEQDFGYVTAAAASSAEFEQAAAVPPDCITADKVRADYAKFWPEFKLSNLDPQAYMKAFNAQPPASNIPPPDELILADDARKPTIMLLAFRGGVFLGKGRAVAGFPREGDEGDARVEHLT